MPGMRAPAPMLKILSKGVFSIFVLVSLLTPNPEGEIPAYINEPLKSPEIPEIMKNIARCESGERQFNQDGTVLRGQLNPHDVGYFQINEQYHLEKSKSLGYDIYSFDGNIRYALWLYEREGTRPWNWSKSCWGLEI